MSNVSVNNAVNFISNTFAKGAASRIVIVKETKMNKGKGANRNPYLGRVFEVVSYGGWVLGTNYAVSVGNAAERSGCEGAEVNTKPTWHVRFNDFFEVSKKDESKFYLQIQRSEQQGQQVVRTYFLDGRIATPAEVDEIKAWLPSRSETMSSTQVAAGVSEDNERHYRLIALENVAVIAQGVKVYQNNALSVSETAAAFAAAAAE